MPSSSRLRNRLELSAALFIGGAAALGMVTLLKPQSLSGLPNLQKFSAVWNRVTNPQQGQPPDSSPLLSGRQTQLSTRANDMIVPPPVIPEVLPLSPQITAAPEPKAGAAPFIDLFPSHWAYPMVTELLNRDLITGFPDGSFRPDQPMNRAEFASQLARTFDFDPTESARRFIDVTPENWAAEDIQTTVRMGFLSGYPEDKFYPEKTIERIQALTALTQGLNLTTSSGSKVVVRYFKDYEQVPDWAINPLLAATEAGLVVNHPDLDRLNPKRPATRAEVATMIYRALVYIGHIEDVSSPHWVQPEPMAY